MEGISYAKNPSKAETFADDTSLMTKFTEANLENTVAIITAFSKISGLHANLEETSELTKMPRSRSLTDTFTLLGVTFDSRMGKMVTKYDDKYNKVEGLIEKWKKRMLTIPGRLMIAKCILLSQYIYLFQTIKISEQMLERIQLQLSNFI